MIELPPLTSAAGHWRGANILQDPHSGKPDRSGATATVTPVLGGRFVRLDYSWGYQGMPQEGSVLIGLDGTTITAYWIDTWHMGHKAMLCVGQKVDGPTLGVRGSYAAPPGPDWGWRIDVTVAAETLRLVMYNIWPQEQGGKEELAAEASFARA